MSNFHPLEFVGRGSETQLQVDENFILIVALLWLTTHGLKSEIIGL